MVSERLPNSYLDKIELGEPMGLLYTGKNLRLYSGDFRKDGTTQYQIRFVNDAGKRVTCRAPADVDPKKMQHFFRATGQCNIQPMFVSFSAYFLHKLSY